jgi:hypothetical protein
LRRTAGFGRCKADGIRMVSNFFWVNQE